MCYLTVGKFCQLRSRKTHQPFTVFSVLVVIKISPVPKHQCKSTQPQYVVLIYGCSAVDISTALKS